MPSPTKVKIAPQTLLKADTVTLAAAATKDGKLRLTCNAWEDARVILVDQVVELRCERGQIVITRKPKK